MADTLFDGVADQPVIDPEKNYFDELVGEGKKYKDPVAAGRALVEKDTFIEQLKRENAAAREEIAKRKSAQELIDQINTARTKADPPPANHALENDQDPPTNPTPSTKVEDLVQAAIQAELSKRTASDNRRKVAEVLKANYGSGYSVVLTEKVAALGLGQKFIDDLAGTSPEAVYNLLGVTATPKTTPNTAQGTRANPGTAPTGSRKNFAYYENMRRTNKDQYFSVRNSQEMIAAAEAQGDDFYR